MGRARVLCAEVEELFREGLSAAQMARRLGVTTNTIYNKLRTLGLSITERDRGSGRYLQLERIAQQTGTVEVIWTGEDYVAIVGTSEGAPMRSVEAAIDSALAVRSEGDLCEAG